MANQSVIAIASMKPVTFEMPCLEFAVFVPEDQGGNALILPVGDGITLTNYTVCTPGMSVPFSGALFRGFQVVRETVNTTLYYYLTKFAVRP